jgi:hypothetical protein
MRDHARNDPMFTFESKKNKTPPGGWPGSA